MHQVMNFMEEKIMPPLFKMASNKYLLAIRDAFTSTLAIVLIGSVFLLICYFPNESWAEFIGPYVPMLSVPNTLTLGLIALYMAFAIGYALANAVNLQPLVNGVATTAIFLIMVNPLTADQSCLSWFAGDLLCDSSGRRNRVSELSVHETRHLNQNAGFCTADYFRCL